MTDLTQSEISTRLAALDGPWCERGRKSYRFLKIKMPEGVLPADPEEVVDLIALERSLGSAKRGELICRVLRAHWDDGVYDRREVAIRESLDEALVMPQLWELAIESGYLPLDAIQLFARDVLVKLLWSRGARAFIQNYGYATVPFLAARVGVVIGQRPLIVPPASAGNEQRFSSFLAEVRDWYLDENLERWLAFLDGYREIRLAGTQLKFLLRGNVPNAEYTEYLGSLLLGAQSFRQRLADFASTLSAVERPMYGSFFIYWLARYHGYRSGEQGYYPAQTNWSKELEVAFRGDVGDDDITRILQSFWTDTLAFAQPGVSHIP